jgi:NAD(P)-dependent dehydrogenase (short-subunit alcohol dehydrogenase family)
MPPNMKPNMSSGTVVLITGCSSGFGLLMAETLARKNYHVFATMRAVDGRNAKTALAFRTLAERESLHLDVLELDVTDNASIERAVDVVIAQTDRIDVLINNAGYGLLGLVEACTLEQAQRIFDTNFFGAVRMNRAVLPHMRRHGSGLLVHISSGAGRVPMPGGGLYSASKFALEALAEAYRHELASQGIDSVIVEPGAFVTPIFQKQEQAVDTLRSSSYGPASEIPQKFMKQITSSTLNPQEVADSVLNLIERPAGNRPLRLTVGLPVDTFGGLNYFTAQLQKDILNWAGIASLATFRAPV